MGSATSRCYRRGAQEAPKDSLAALDATASFQDHLSRGAVVAALQLLASLFAESGAAEAVDLSLQTSVLQQVTTFHVPVQLLLKAVEQELKPRPGATAAELAFQEAFMLSASSAGRAPPNFAAKVADLRAGLQLAATTAATVEDRMSAVNLQQLAGILEALGRDAQEPLDKLNTAIRDLRPLVQSLQSTAQAAKVFWQRAEVVKQDVADMEAGKIHVVDFCKHVEAASAAATSLEQNVKAAAAAAKTFVDDAKALVTSVEGLVDKLKAAANEQAAALEGQLPALRALPAAALEAATGSAAASALASALEADLLAAAKSLGEDALRALLATLEGDFCGASWEAALRDALVASLSDLVRSTARSILASAASVAAHLAGGTVTHTVGFHFESWLSLQLTVVVDLEQLAAGLARGADLNR